MIPTALDVYKPERWQNNALYFPESSKAFKQLVDQGWVDALRELHPDERIYTFWDYLRNAYGRDAGLRLDHFLLSPETAGRLLKAGVDRHSEGGRKAVIMRRPGSNWMIFQSAGKKIFLK